MHQEQAKSLFKIRSPDQLRALLDDLGVGSSTSWKWLPVGGREANATNVELSTEQAPPIVERITNGVDALLELAQANLGGEPGSPREAGQQWFGIPGGTLSGLENGRDLVSSLAPKVRVDVYEAGVDKAPSVAIRDEGIGQHPLDLPGTILSLGESNKIGTHYLVGAYGHGGSSALAWCQFTIIVSRRRPEHTNGRPDLVGWTVVRKYDDVSLKVNTYQYLATEDRAIATFSPKLLDGTGFLFGTYVIHVAYELGRYSAIWSRVGYRLLNNLLFDPVLPYAVRDHREPRPQDRYMPGNRARLKDADLEYSSEYVAALGEDGNLIIRYWVFKESSRDSGEEDEGVKIDSYLEAKGSTRTVAITLNGQRHSYLEKSLIKNNCRYALLPDSLLVQVDCDQLSRQRKKDLFPATRTGVRAGERRLELIENCLVDALASDDELKRIERERVERRLAQLDEKGEREVRRLLDRLIAVTHMAEGQGTGKADDVGRGAHRYKPKDPPTVFRFVDEATPVRVEPGGLRLIGARTDGPNDMLHRLKRRARLRLEVIGDASVSLRTGVLRDGRLPLTLVGQANAVVGSQGTLRAVLEMDPDVYLFTERPCVIAAPPPPYVGSEPPTGLEIAGQRIRLRRGRQTSIGIRTNCRDDLLSRARDQAYLDVRCSVAQVHLVGRRGPRKGNIDVHFLTPEGVSAEAEGILEARLTLCDGTVLQDVKPCVVRDPPAREQGAGADRHREPNYKIVPVWKDRLEGRDGLTWDVPGLLWDEGHVGKHDLSGDLLLLYVNMDHSELVKERTRRLTTVGEAAAERLDLRYKAYIAYHLWLHFERSRSLWEAQRTGPTDGIPEPDSPGERQNDDDESVMNIDDEMRRVAKTVLLAMRSEKDLLRQLTEAD